MSKLLNYQWPGNVRELQHTIEKAVILCDSNELSPDDFFFKQAMTGMQDIFDGTIEEMEIKMINRILHKNSQNLSAAAEQLGISRQTLYNKMKKYKL